MHRAGVGECLLLVSNFFEFGATQRKISASPFYFLLSPDGFLDASEIA